jgi:ketosteroid isomerase-like protein
MRVMKPEDMSAVFASLVNAGDLDALADLYETNVRYVSRSGDVAEGVAGVRQAFRWVAGFKGEMEVKNAYCVVAGDIALVRAAWRLNGVAADGRRLEGSGSSAEVLRRQADGAWRYAIDHPRGADAPAKT